MIVEEYKTIRNTYALIGTAREFNALSNIINIAKIEGTDFSNTEATIMYEIQREVQNNIPEEKK